MLSVDAAAPEGEGLTLLTGRDLYTDRLSAARGDVNADLLHRGESLQIHPADAANLNIQHGQSVIVSNTQAEIEARAEVTEDVPQGATFLPILHNRAAAHRLTTSPVPHPCHCPPRVAEVRCYHGHTTELDNDAQLCSNEIASPSSEEKGDPIDSVGTD